MEKCKAKTACKGSDAFAHLRQTLDSGSNHSSRSTSSKAAPSQTTSPQLPCPPYSAQIGRATWTFLHTMAANYPDAPDQPTQTNMQSFLRNFSLFYPCGYCADHMREEMKHKPPVTSSRKELGLWMCELHNEVGEVSRPVPCLSLPCIFFCFLRANVRGSQRESVTLDSETG